MKLIHAIFLSFLFTSFTYGQTEKNTNLKRINSTIDSTINNEIVLIQEFLVYASIDSVWNAYTTKEGWKNWAAPIAEIDLKVGGFIKTNYNPDGTIGDSSTIVIHIINYVPKKILTLQSEITSNFPEFMKKEAQDFYNVIYFEELDNETTYIRSFGIGYKNNSKYLSLLKYFISANEMSLLKLIEYLEAE